MPTTAYVTHNSYRLHTLEGHPERAERIEYTWKVFESAGILRDLKLVEPYRASLEQLALVHDAGHIVKVKEASERGGGMLDPDTYALPVSYDIARLSSGGVLAAVDAMMQGQADNALCVIRPPGHHATPVHAMGFCLFNNIAVAARYAQLTYEEIERVLIVDIDVHHGNGTQDAFYGDPSVLFISSHQYPFYPGTGAMRETGMGDAKGTTINIPLPAGTGNAGFKLLFEQIVWPAARRFDPHLMLVSIGLDAHWADPLAMLQLDLHGYAYLTRELVTMANELTQGRIAFILEGGYDLDVLSHGLLNVAYTLLGQDEIVDPVGPLDMPEQNVQRVVTDVMQLHQL